MEAAKQAISKLTSHGGTHDTVVDETVNPAVTSETVRPTRHEETTQAVDKEVHQDHYHTTVQPLQHREQLPEQHTHQQMPVQEREFHHGDSAATQRGIEAEQAAFQDSSRTLDTAHSSSQAAGVTGEHIHHHVHETVQPVVHKETIQPEVVHTTIPIHERHHAPSEHHGLSTMPVKSLDEFKTTGVPLTGTGHRSEQYEGDPRRYNPSMQSNRPDVDVHPERHDGMHTEPGEGSTGTGYSAGTSSAQTGALRGAESSGQGYGGSTGGYTSETAGTDGFSTGAGSTGFGAGTSAAQTGALRGAESSGQGYGGSTGGYTSGTTGGEGFSTGTSSTGFGAGTSAAQTGALRGAESSGQDYGSTGTGGSGNEYSSRDTSGVTPAHNITTADSSTAHSGGYSTGNTGSTTGNTGSTAGNTTSHTTSHDPRDSAHSDHHHVEGHGISNQVHHGSSLDNTARDDDRQHGDQGRDPAMVEDKSDKKLTGTGVDGSHSAVFGLTPDGHKHTDTKHGSGAPKPAHSKDGVSNVEKVDNDTVASQMTDPRVAEKGHGGSAEYDQGSTKPGAGGMGGNQGFGEVRSQDHGASSQMKQKLDPSTDADNDGKRGVMD